MSCDLRAPGWLARHPMVGTIMFIMGSLLFGVLAYELKTQGPLLRWDIPLASSLHATALAAPAGPDGTPLNQPPGRKRLRPSQRKFGGDLQGEPDFRLRGPAG